MGRCKQLLYLDGRPAVVRCLESILAAGIGEVTVVVGPSGEEVAQAVAHLPVAIARNGIVGGDMAQSVRTGLEQVGSAASGVLVCLADHPLVTAATCCLLAEEHRRTPEAILIPTFRGRKGHPTLFPRGVIAELAYLPTLREVIAARPERVRLLPVDDPGVVEDMDFPADYRRLVLRLDTCP
jgi:CTP:molybdopterin cytidylyltransferase MocA